MDEEFSRKKTKKHIIEEVDNPKELPPYFNVPYPQCLKKEVKDQQFSKFLELFKKLQINIPFAETLQQMRYAKYVKETLSNKRKLKEEEMVLLTKECSTIILKKILVKMKDPGGFTIPCAIGHLNIGRALCDLGASRNLISLYFQEVRDWCGETNKNHSPTSRLLYCSSIWCCGGFVSEGG